MSEPELIELAILRTIYQMDQTNEKLRPVRMVLKQLALEVRGMARVPFENMVGELELLRKATA